MGDSPSSEKTLIARQHNQKSLSPKFQIRTPSYDELYGVAANCPVSQNSHMVVELRNDDIFGKTLIY